MFFCKYLTANSIPSQLLIILHKNYQIPLDILRLNRKTLKSTLATLFETGTFESE
jgi:hypothetical protein